MTPEEPLREPAVAGSFYPASAPAVRSAVATCLAAARAATLGTPPVGILVPHAGLVYSGALAAAGWRALLEPGPPDQTVVVLGTSHRAWLDGVAVFAAGAWRTPIGEVRIDETVAGRILALGEPFRANPSAHRDEHSIEVQLPLVQTLRPGARIVPCSVSAGTGGAAVSAGARLGALLADLRAEGFPILLAISTDMAHYPAHDAAVRATERLVPHIAALDPGGLTAAERAVAQSSVPGMACGMCGIEPTVLGLAALRAMGAVSGTVLAAATSADAGGGSSRTVGYLTVAFA